MSTHEGEGSHVVVAHGAHDSHDVPSWIDINWPWLVITYAVIGISILALWNPAK